MPKIKVNDIEYDVEKLSDNVKKKLALINFTDGRVKELVNLQALLQRARNSYIESLNREIISNKTGVLFNDDWGNNNYAENYNR